MKYKQILSMTILSLSTVGCAMTSGFQTHELPEQDGVFTTDLGTPVSLIKVTQETLPAVQPMLLYFRIKIQPTYSAQAIHCRFNCGLTLKSPHLWHKLRMIKLSLRVVIKLIRVVIYNFRLLDAIKHQVNL